MALLQRCLKDKHGYVASSVLMEDGKPVTPTLGGGVGPRLDRWLCATNEAGERELFQIEIKNWSAHAIGGRRLALDATDERRVAVGRHYWGRIWDQDSGTLREESARKVLTRMQLPRAYHGINADVVPLICFWWYVTNPQDDKPDSLFELQLNNPSTDFKRLKIFSVSNYLRSLSGGTGDQIEIDMPQAQQRTAWMKRIFGSSL